MAAIGEWLCVAPRAISKFVRSSEQPEQVNEAYRAKLGSCLRRSEARGRAVGQPWLRVMDGSWSTVSRFSPSRASYFRRPLA